MLGLPLVFAAPAVLVALVALAALWWFLRVTPPRPREESFPPLRLLLGLVEKAPTPARTPWPLLVLRLLVAAAVVLAMAGPIWNAIAARAGAGALLVILDDGWTAAPTWVARVAAAREAMRAATQAGRLVALAPISAGGEEIHALDAEGFEQKLAALAPNAYAPPRDVVVAPLGRFLAADPKAEILWIADGVELGGAGAFAASLKSLAGGHDVSVALDGHAPVALAGVESLPGAMKARLTRPGPEAADQGLVRAYDAEGRAIAEAPFHFAGAATTEASFELPVELRNDITRLAIVGEASAGATWLVDERARRRRVAIASGASADLASPLLSPTYYIRRALEPTSDIREAKPGEADPIGALIDEKPSALALADMSIAPGPTHDRLTRFVEGGGVLIRFAGTRLAAGEDDLTPTALRRGGRTLGGALSWETPKHVAAFEPPSPFVGVPAPEEVTVSRQVLAEPDPGLVEKTWARLADGTPLVTASRRGKGLIVLFHVTADTTWSNLPISGLFVEMLRRTVAQAAAGSAPAAGSRDKAQVALPPWRTLDGYGALVAPPPSARPIPETFAGVGDAEHPPGFYGAADAVVPVNALAEGATLARADYAGLRQRSGGLNAHPPVELKPWLLLIALIGFLADGLASLWLGRSRALGRPAAALALALFVALAPAPQPASAQSLAADERSALETRIGYVVTGDAEVDETSRLGLIRLGQVLTQRTSAAVADPVALDPAHDELAFYPLIYWPIVAGRPQPPAAATAQIAAYMKNGGTIIFDTRDALLTRTDGPPTAEGRWLRALLAGVDVPELEPVPRDHVLTKTFYLIDHIVGRTDMGATWVEALPPPDPTDRTPRPARAGDSVSPIIVTSNDLAGAWAVDDSGTPRHPLTPGSPRQREMALRAGVNLVMYALTGNYKADQVHAKDLLERLAH